MYHYPWWGSHIKARCNVHHINDQPVHSWDSLPIFVFKSNRHSLQTYTLVYTMRFTAVVNLPVVILVLVVGAAASPTLFPLAEGGP